MKSVKPYPVAIALPYPGKNKSVLNSRLGKLIANLKKWMRWFFYYCWIFSVTCNFAATCWWSPRSLPGGKG